MASGSLENSRSRTGIPLVSLLLRKNRTAQPSDDAGGRRFPLRVRAAEVSGAFFESAVGAVIAANSLFISFLQKLALLQEIGVALADHLLLRKFSDKQAARVRFRAAVFDQAPVIAPDNPVGPFGPLPYPVDFLHAGHHVRPWRVLDRLN